MQHELSKNTYPTGKNEDQQIAAWAQSGLGRLRVTKKVAIKLDVADAKGVVASRSGIGANHQNSEHPIRHRGRPTRHQPRRKLSRQLDGRIVHVPPEISPQNPVIGPLQQ